MPFPEWIGMIAGMLTTAAFVPQVWQAWRTKDTRAISLPMYVIFTTGVVLWFTYGWCIGSWPIMINNAMTFCLAGTVLWCKWRSRGQS